MNHSRLNKLAKILKSAGFHNEAKQVNKIANWEGDKPSTLDSSRPDLDWREKIDSAVAKIIPLLLKADLTHPDELEDLCDKLMHHDDLKRAELDKTQREEIDRPFDSDEMLSEEAERAREEAMIEEQEEREGSLYTPGTDISRFRFED